MDRRLQLPQEGNDFNQDVESLRRLFEGAAAEDVVPLVAGKGLATQADMGRIVKRLARNVNIPRLLSQQGVSLTDKINGLLGSCGRPNDFIKAAMQIRLMGMGFSGAQALLRQFDDEPRVQLLEPEEKEELKKVLNDTVTAKNSIGSMLPFQALGYQALRETVGIPIDDRVHFMVVSSQDMAILAQPADLPQACLLAFRTRKTAVQKGRRWDAF